MSDAARPVRIDDLLAQREWVRRVALALVRDADAAGDLEQDLWVEVLDRPPTLRGSLRGWLATALRHDLLGRRRGAARRLRREEIAARPEAQPSADELVARAEAADRVMHAVLELTEPYRSTILLHYVEGTALAQVAGQSGVPLETVRTRHKRALATLRERLGKGHGGNAWIAAIAPIAGIRVDAGAAAGTSGATVAGITGGSIMGAKATVVAAVGLVLAAGFAGGQISASTGDEGSAAHVAELVRRVESLEARGVSGGRLPTATASERRSAAVGEKQAAQDRRIDGLEADLAAALATAPKHPRVDAELDRLKGLTTEELLVEARKLVSVAKYTKAVPDAEAVLRASDLLLARRLETEQRAESLILKGRGYAVLGDRANEEAALREALTIAGASSAQGRFAAVDLAYAANRRGDPCAAAEWFLGIARQSDTKPGERAFYRYNAANFLLSGRETVRARDEYRVVVDEFGNSDDKDARKWADFARTELAKLDGAGGGR